ncbi:MAG: hypothetical protein U0V70_00205 [Terriglobia bacterium]
MTLRSVAALSEGGFVAVGERSDGVGIILHLRINQGWSVTYTNGPGLYCVAAGGEQLVTVGKKGTILISSNGIDWVHAASEVTNDLRAVAYSGTTWMSVGLRGTITTAMNPLAWTNRTGDLSQFDLLSLTHADGAFMVVGGTHLGHAFSSVDGVRWTITQIEPSTTALVAVAHGNGRYVAVTAPGVVAISPDGAGWTTSTLGSQYFDAQSLTYARGRFLASVKEGLLSSADGIRWVRDYSSPRPASWLRGVAFSGEEYVGVGDFLVRGESGPLPFILRAEGSKPYVDQIVLTNNAVKIFVSGGTPAKYGVETATRVDAPSWISLGEIAAPEGMGSFEGQTDNEAQRIYRVKAE